jgi:hypothetical protein
LLAAYFYVHPHIGDNGDDEDDDDDDDDDD